MEDDTDIMMNCALSQMIPWRQKKIRGCQKIKESKNHIDRLYTVIEHCFKGESFKRIVEHYKLSPMFQDIIDGRPEITKILLIMGPTSPLKNFDEDAVPWIMKNSHPSHLFIGMLFDEITDLTYKIQGIVSYNTKLCFLEEKGEDGCGQTLTDEINETDSQMDRLYRSIRGYSIYSCILHKLFKMFSGHVGPERRKKMYENLKIYQGWFHTFLEEIGDDDRFSEGQYLDICNTIKIDYENAVKLIKSITIKDGIPTGIRMFDLYWIRFDML